MNRNDANTCSDLIEQSLTAAGWEFDCQVVMAGHISIKGESPRLIVVSLPPGEKQHALVERVDRIDTAVCNLQRTLTNETLKGSLMPAAVLREAFAAEL